MPIDLRFIRHAPVQRLVAGLVLWFACRGVAQTALPKDSPFLPPAGAVVTAAAPVGGLEFAAVFGEGTKTYIALFDLQLKKSRWIPVGGTAEGVAVLNYDAVRNQVVVRINGAEKILTLRKERGTVAGPALSAPPALSYTAPAPTPQPVFERKALTAEPMVTSSTTPALATAPATTTPGSASANTGQWAVSGFSIPPPMPISAYQTPLTSTSSTGSTVGNVGTVSAGITVNNAPAAPATPATPAPDAKPAAPTTPPSIAKQEEEARMLVSDLLEIGMAQRKAYEEAQRKAAEQQAQTGKPPGG